MRIKQVIVAICAFVVMVTACTFNPFASEGIEQTELTQLEAESLVDGLLVYSDDSSLEAENARGISVSPSSGYVTVTENPAGTYHLQINLRPDGKTHYRKVLFSVYNNSTPSGWLVNIGDSATNNGYGGDSGTQSNDCELQVLNSQVSIYASDYGNSQRLYTASGYHTSSSTNVRYEISNNTVKMWRNFNTNTTVSVNNSSLFALDGRSDSSGEINHTIYAGFNRTINSATRSGTGISNIYVYLQDPIPEYQLIQVNQDYSATLRHLMYRKSTLSGKWYANTGFDGYQHFLNGKDPNNWNEKAKEHIFVVEYWKPPVANIKNVVFLAAGQQGALIDRQDYPAIVTGQKADWHHYSGAPWNAINTWQYMKDATKPINWKSIAGQIIADGTQNGGAYFGFTPADTLLVMVFDTCSYVNNLNNSQRNSLTTDYLEWLFAKVGNNTGNKIKNIYLAGASAGGALVYRMAYQMRHNSLWMSRTGSARIIVSGFDAVANHEEGELWTTTTKQDNPLEWINTRFCWYSNLPSYFTNKDNTYMKQIAGGADVIPLIAAKYHAFYYPTVENAMEFAWVDRSHTDIGRNWNEDTSVAQLKWLAKWVQR